MTTDFSSLPVVDLAPLSRAAVSSENLRRLSEELDSVFTTTGFAYLVNPPLSMGHDDIFGLAEEFFCLPQAEKMKLAKRMFRAESRNTYRGYFPPQPGQPDNLKEGFEIGPGSWPEDRPPASDGCRLDLSEPSVWPPPAVHPAESRARLERLHGELQALAVRLVSLLATALGRPADAFASWTDGSISTLRLLHYPPQATGGAPEDGIRLCCTPHTDSGILTLLHQDSNGGLEVQNASGAWVAAPYVPGSIVVNVGDLMARASGGRYVATFHRVRAGGAGRFSVPFFFEPGEDCLIRSVGGGDEGIRYGEHVRGKMSTWVEFQDVEA